MANNELFEFMLALSTEGFRTGLSNAKKDAAQFNKELTQTLAGTNDAFKKTSKTVTTFATKLTEDMNKATKATKDFRDATATNLGASKKGFENLANSIEARLTASAGKLRAFQNDTRQFATNTNAEFARVAQSVQQTAQSLSSYQSALRGVQQQSTRNIPAPTASAPSVSTPGAASRAFNGAQTASQLQTVNDAAAALEQRMNSLAQASSRAFMVLGASIAGPLKIFGDYEATLNRFRSVADATTQDMQRFDAAATQLGQSTQFSSKAVAIAGVELAKLGFTTSEVISVLPGVVKAAAASQIDLASAAEIVAASMKGFKLSVTESTRVADLFSAVSAKSAVDFRDIGESMKYVSGIAQASSNSIETISVLLGIMGEQGLKGSMAATSLRSAFVSLSRPTEDAAKALKSMGIEIADERTGQMRQLTDILKDMGVALKGVDDVTKNATVSTIFGTEALSGMLAVINSGSGSIDGWVKALGNVTGTSDRMAAIAFQGFNAELEKLTSAAETAAKEFGEALAPEATKLIKAIADLATYLGSLPDGFKQGAAQALFMAAQITAMTAAVAGGRAAIASATQAVLAFIGVKNASSAAFQFQATRAAATMIAVQSYNASLQTAAARQGLASTSALTLGTRITAVGAAARATAGAMLTTMIPALGAAALKVAAITTSFFAINEAIKLVQASIEELAAAEQSDKQFTETLEKRQEALQAYNALQKKFKENQGKTPAQLLQAGTITPAELNKAAAGLQNLANAQSDMQVKGAWQQQAQAWRDLVGQYKQASVNLATLNKLQAEYQTLYQQMLTAETNVDKERGQRALKAKEKEIRDLEKLSKANQFTNLKNLEEAARKTNELTAKLKDATDRGNKDSTDKKLQQLNKETEALKRQQKIALDNLLITQNSLKIEEQKTAATEQRFKTEEELIKFVAGNKGVWGRGGPGDRGSMNHTPHGYEARDYAVPSGTPLKAAASGTVVSAGVAGAYGNQVVIQHPGGLSTRYAHMSQIAVKPGQVIEQGQQIGLSGGDAGAPGSGRSSGAHLHLEVLRNGVQVAIEEFAGMLGVGKGKTTQKAIIDPGAVKAQADMLRTQIQQLKAQENKLRAAGYTAEADELVTEQQQKQQKIFEIEGRYVEQSTQLAEQRAQEIADTERGLVEEIMSLNESLREESKQFSRSLNQQFMTDQQKALDDALNKISDLEQKAAQYRKKVQASNVSAAAASSIKAQLETYDRQLQEVVSAYATSLARADVEVFERRQMFETKLSKEAAAQQDAQNKRTIEGIQKRVAQGPRIIFDENQSPVAVEVEAQNDLLPLLRQRLQYLDQQLAKQRLLTEEERMSEANMTKVNELKDEMAGVITEINIAESGVTQELDKQIAASAQLNLNYEQLGQVLSNVSEGLDVAARFVSVVGGNAPQMQQFGDMLEGASRASKGIGEAFQKLQDGDWIGAAITGVLALGTEVANALGFFPNQQDLDREANAFKISMMQIDAEIERNRAEARLRLGLSNLQQYYDEMRRAEEKELAASIAQIEQQYEDAITNIAGAGDLLSLLFTGQFTEQTQTRISRAATVRDAQIQAASQRQRDAQLLAAQQQGRQRAAGTRGAMETEAATQVSRANRIGSGLDVIDAELRAGQLGVYNQAAEGMGLFMSGEITQAEFTALNNQLAENLETLQTTADDKRRQYYASLRDLDFEHRAFEIEQTRTGLDKRLAAEDLATEKELAGTRDRLQQLEAANLTWTDEYQKLKRREEDILKASNQRKIVIDRDYQMEMKDLQLQMQEAIAGLTAGELDNLVAARNRSLLDLTKWKDQLIAQYPEQAAFITEMFLKLSAKAQADSDKAIAQNEFNLRDASREILNLEAEATADTLDDVQVQYQTTLDRINDMEQMALNDYTKTEKEKVEATRRAAAERLKAEKTYMDGVKNAAIQQLNQLKDLREQLFESDTRRQREMLAEYQRQLAVLDNSIRERQLMIDRIRAKYDEQKRQFGEEDLTRFEQQQAALDIGALTREALKFNQVNISANQTADAARKTQQEAIEVYAKYLQDKAQNDRILKLISEEEMNRRLQEATILQAGFARDQMAAVEAQYNAEIAAQEAAGMSEEQVDLLRGKKVAEMEALRKSYAEAFNRYKELEIAALDGAMAKEAEGTQKSIDNDNLRRQALLNNITEQEIAIEKFSAQYQSDMSKIDEAVKRVQNSHQQMSFAMSDVERNLTGSIDKVIAKYKQLADAAKQATAATGGATTNTGTTTDGSALPPRSRTKSGPYLVDFGDGWYYQSTTDAMKYKAAGLKDGGIIKDVPWLRGRDAMGPFMLDAGEEVISRGDRMTLLDHIAALPDRFARTVSQSNYSSSNTIGQIVMNNEVRNDSDLQNLISIVREVMGAKDFAGSNKYGYLTR